MSGKTFISLAVANLMFFAAWYWSGLEVALNLCALMTLGAVASYIWRKT